jgi:hypothetical protein
MQKLERRVLLVAFVLLYLGAGYVISLYFSMPETGYFFGILWVMMVKATAGTLA